uniref:Reverse transcriptase domain-containing protein n=1 Tax=Photinus pyralis TaxID=7054 RepID=A0A1Y1K5G1_PHOPY
MFTLNKITAEDFRNAIKKLKPKKAAGNDMFPPYIVGGSSEWLEKPLLHIYNLAIKTETFPDMWKESIVVPIHKSGNKKLVENYRPIAILSAPAKLFELILHTKLFIHIKPSLDDSQHGFVSHKSTLTNLLTFTNHVQESLDSKQQVDVIYTDFTKAFDKVDHDLLLGKLYLHGLTLHWLNFFASYLKNRTFKVKFDGNTSGKFEANSGVRQGSNLGPLLFLIFINDLRMSIITSNSLMFADDLKIYSELVSVEDCNLLQKDIDRLLKWSLNNKLPLNISKCLVLSIFRTRINIRFDYEMFGTKLKRVESIKDLGVVYDSSLNFNKHIENIATSAYKMLGFVLRQSANFKCIRTLKILYFTLVRPRLEYASIVWLPHTLYQIKRIEKVQNRFLRFLYFKKNNTYPEFNVRSADLRHEFEIQSLANRRSIALVQFGHKLWNNLVDQSYLLSLMTLKVPNRATRSTDMFHIPTTTFRFHSPLLAMLRLLNQLLTSIIDLDLSLPFKKFSKLVIVYYSSN